MQAGALVCSLCDGNGLAGSVADKDGLSSMSAAYCETVA